MKQTTSKQSLHLGSALVGAICGGMLVITLTKAIPTMLAKLMSGMMETMKSKMEACGCNPQEMCQKMMAAIADAPKEGESFFRQLFCG
jgi:hypothetical protein